MRSKGVVDLEYSWDGEPYSYHGEYDGYETDTSYVLSYSYSGERLEYTLDLTVYLDCSSADGVFVAGAGERALKKGESTEVYAILECGNEPIPDRVVTFTLSGPGKLSSQTALTNEDGEASVTYTADEDGTAEVTASLDGCTCSTPGVAEDSVTIAVGQKGQMWSADATFDYHFATVIWSADGTYDAAMQFTVSEPQSGMSGVDGIAQVTQDLSIVSVNEGWYISDTDAPSDLELVVSGSVKDGYLSLILEAADYFYTVWYCFYDTGWCPDPSYGGSSLLIGSEFFDDGTSVRLEEGTFTGGYTIGGIDYLVTYTITLERLQ
jgi:hypothetical protein